MFAAAGSDSIAASSASGSVEAQRRMRSPTGFDGERKLRLPVCRHGHGPLQRVSIRARALDALRQDLAIAPQSALTNIHRHGFIARVTDEIAHRIARTPEARALLTLEGRLHGDVERLADLDRKLGALRRMIDAVLADELRLALGAAHVDAHDACGKLRPQTAARRVREPDDRSRVRWFLQCREPRRAVFVHFACRDAFGIQESDLLRLIVRDGRRLGERIDIVVGERTLPTRLAAGAAHGPSTLLFAPRVARIVAYDVDVPRDQLSHRIRIART